MEYAEYGSHIFDFMSQYGYWVILPLMIIEGPVATIIAATLAALGAFNVYVVLTLSVIGDVLGDVLFYVAGRKYGMRFVNKIGKYIGITERVINKMERYFEKHGGKTIFAVKATTGLCWATFVAAGIVKMKFKKFLWYSLLGGIVWSGFLVAMGYFYGYLWREIGIYIDWIGWVISGLVIGTYVLITLFRREKTKNVFPNRQ